MATKLHQRTFALIMALLFLVTSLAFSFIVIMELTGGDESTSTSEQLSEEEALRNLNAQQNQQTQVNQQETNNEGENMLKGTKLSGFDPIESVDELQKIDLVEGTGTEVPEGATVTVHYTGAYAVNGEIFESSKDGGEPVTFPLSGVIAGWTEGVPGMKEGGTRRLVIPGEKAYGEAPEGYTPGSTDRPQGTLVFDIELISIQ